MGKERKWERQKQGTEILKDELLNYLEDASFGSAKYEGFMDSMIKDILLGLQEDLLNR
jgi:hypothetical protein